MMSRCYFLAQKVATAVKYLSNLKFEFETYLARETITEKQIALIDKVLHSFNQVLTDLEALKEALK